MNEKLEYGLAIEGALLIRNRITDPELVKRVTLLFSKPLQEYLYIFCQWILGAEMFTDASKYTLVDDVVYEVEGKIITVKDDMSSVNIGANESQEEASEALEEGFKRGVNVVIYSRLEELVDFAKFTVEQYMKYMKAFMKTLALPEDPAEKAALQKKISGYLNRTLGKKWKNLEKFDQYYGEGASIDPDKLPMVVLLNYREEDDTPYLVYFKHGLIEEKV